MVSGSFINMPKRLTLQHCIDLARQKGGLCVSYQYVNNKTKMMWECQYGHIWDTTYDSIKSGGWCPQCVKKSLEDCQDLARQKGGICVSSEYVNNKTKMRWECEYGHQWTATYNDIRKGSWCPTCRKKTLEHCIDLARHKGGLCVSSKYVNNSTKMYWQCKYGHEWDATFASINRGQWCPYCAGLAKKSLQHCIDVAVSRNGTCLSSQYVNNSTKMRWQCKEGHQWDAKYNTIQQGSWCPRCNESKGERSISEILSELNIAYEREWRLPNSSLRCDFYLPQHKIVIEYDGIQHFEISRWSKTYDELRVIQERDVLKNKLVLSLECRMIRISYCCEDIRKFICEAIDAEESFIVSNRCLYKHHLTCYSF